MENEPVVRVAAKAAIINKLGQVLIVRESSADKDNTKVGKWGLPGGRLNLGETFVEGLNREVEEEVGLEVVQGDPLYVGEWHPNIRGVAHQIIAVFLRCTPIDGQEVRLGNELDAYKWIDPATREDYDMMEPDCYVVDKLVEES